MFSSANSLEKALVSGVKMYACAPGNRNTATLILVNGDIVVVTLDPDRRILAVKEKL